MSKQFYLIRLNNDRSMYTESDWEAIFSRIRHHNGKDVRHTHHRAVRPDGNGRNICYITHSAIRADEKGKDVCHIDSRAAIPDENESIAEISLSCCTFKSDLTSSKARQRITEG